jgi:hypothetical protein
MPIWAFEAEHAGKQMNRIPNGSRPHLQGGISAGEPARGWNGARVRLRAITSARAPTFKPNRAELCVPIRKKRIGCHDTPVCCPTGHSGVNATLIKWRNRHDTCLRADRGALAQMDWPSFKAAQQRDARRQVSPNRLYLLKQVASRRSASRTAQLVKATSLHFATRQD